MKWGDAMDTAQISWYSVVQAESFRQLIVHWHVKEQSRSRHSGMALVLDKWGGRKLLLVYMDGVRNIAVRVQEA